MILSVNVAPYQLLQNDLVAIVMYEKDASNNNTQNVCGGVNLSYLSQNARYGYASFDGNDLPSTSGSWDTFFIETCSNGDSRIRFRRRLWL